MTANEKVGQYAERMFFLGVLTIEELEEILQNWFSVV